MQEVEPEQRLSAQCSQRLADPLELARMRIPADLYSQPRRHMRIGLAQVEAEVLRQHDQFGPCLSLSRAPVGYAIFFSINPDRAIALFRHTGINDDQKDVLATN